MVETRSGSGTVAADDRRTEGSMDIEQTGEHRTTPMSNDDTEQETIEQRYARLQEQLKQKRMLEDIERMTAELAGETPAERIEIAGLPSRHKRAASSAPPYAPPTRLVRTAEPPSYEAKNLKDAANYENGWKIHIRTLPPMNDESLINLAATYLKGKAQEFWVNNHVSIKTWDEYMEWCRGLVVDPVNRMQYALIRLKSVEQRPNQSVRDLVAIIENLEKDIPEMSEQEKRAWQLLACLSPGIRREVLKENRTITSREQVIAAAQRQEELAREPQSQEKGKSQSNQANSEPEKQHARKTHASRGRYRYHQGSRTEKSEKSEKDEKGERSKGGFLCYNCDKPGHLAKDCRKPKKASSLPAPSKNQIPTS